MVKDLVIVKLDAASRMLAEAKTIQETKRIVDMAAAAEVYARRQKLGAEAVEYATAIKVEALRQLGTMLKDAPKNSGSAGTGRPSLGGTTIAPPKINVPTYADIGLDKKTASLAQRIADLPEEQFEAVKRGTMALAQAVNAHRREQVYEAKVSRELPEDAFNVILADPPWSYSNSGFSQSAANQYPTMTTDDICALGVSRIADTDAALFLWVTSPLLPDGLRVMDAWGFEYKASMVWLKDRAPGMGFWVNTRHEFLIIGGRGSFLPKEKLDSVILSQVTEHSRKPDQVYDVIETMYPGAAKCELFARRSRAGWKVWGNEQ